MLMAADTASSAMIETMMDVIVHVRMRQIFLREPLLLATAVCMVHHYVMETPARASTERAYQTMGPQDPRCRTRIIDLSSQTPLSWAAAGDF